MKNIIRSILFSTALITLLSIVNACNNSENEKTTNEVVEKPAKKEKIKEREMMSYNGTNVKEGVMPKVGNSSYSIEISLNDKDTKTEFKNSDTSPPMPFNIGGWTMTKKGPNKFFVHNSDNKVGTNFTFKKGWNTIKIVADAKKNKTHFFLNNKMTSVKPGFTRLKSFYLLGKGHNNRYWMGDVKMLTVQNLDKKQIVFEL